MRAAEGRASRACSAAVARSRVGHLTLRAGIRVASESFPLHRLFFLLVSFFLGSFCPACSGPWGWGRRGRKGRPSLFLLHIIYCGDGRASTSPVPTFLRSLSDFRNEDSCPSQIVHPLNSPHTRHATLRTPRIRVFLFIWPIKNACQPRVSQHPLLFTFFLHHASPRERTRSADIASSLAASARDETSSASTRQSAVAGCARK
jgi:hypothetical protein